jgi:hypothetical protein
MTDDALLMPVEEILRRANGTAVTDDRGLPLIVYHGTFARFDKFTITKDLGFHFGTWEAAAIRRRLAPARPVKTDISPRWRVIGACLRLKNPLIFLADPASWHELAVMRILESALPAERIATLKNKIDLASDEHKRVTKKLDDIIKLAMQDIKITPEQIDRKVKSKAGRPRWYDKHDAEDDLRLQIRNKMVPKILEKCPELASNYDPMAIIKSELIAAGYDGIGYVNWYEKKNSLSWVAFHDEDIIRVTQDDLVMALPATDQDVQNSNYQPRQNPLTAPPVNVRTPNRGYMSGREAISFQAAIVRLASQTSEFTVTKKIDEGSYTRRMYLKYQGIEFLVSTGAEMNYQVPIRRLDNEQWVAGDLTDRSAMALKVRDIPKVSNEVTAIDCRPYSVFEWQMYHSPTEAAADLLATIARFVDNDRLVAKSPTMAARM